jgi:hypothetical protein
MVGRTIPAQEGAVLLGVGERDQHVADLDLHRVDPQELLDVLGLVAGRRGLLERLGLLGRVGLLDGVAGLALHGVGEAAQAARHHEERHLRQARDDGEQGQDAGDHVEGTRVTEHLVADVVAQV